MIDLEEDVSRRVRRRRRRSSGLLREALCISADVQHCDERRTDSSDEESLGGKDSVCSMQASRPFTGKYFLAAMRTVEPMNDSVMGQIDMKQQHITYMRMCDGARDDGAKYGVNADVLAMSASRSANTRRGRTVCAPCRRLTGAALAAAAIFVRGVQRQCPMGLVRNSAGGNEDPGVYVIFMKYITYVRFLCS